jgi:flagellar protein FliL
VDKNRPVEHKDWNKKEKPVDEIEVARKMGPIFSLDSFIVNLDDPKLRKYLRITIDLEIIDDKSIPTVQARLPQIRDSILTILPSKRYEEITTVEGKNALRAELIGCINEFFGRELITNIYFSEFVIQ